MASDVRLERVTKNFGSFKAVDDVSLHIEAGEFMSILGSSGAGKSTVLRMIGGFELPDAGKITIGGRDVTYLPPYRRDVNTVFQSYALFPHMTVAENVAYGLRQDHVPRGERTARVRDALDMVQLLHLAHRKPSQLSGGQQQRVALARALVKRPSVLLLDEPLGALDRKLRQQMQVELKLLQHRLELTFVFVTHDQEEALAMSDRIAVMRDGRIEQIGSPAELYDEPRTAYVAGFIGTQNFFSGTTEGADLAALRDDSGLLVRAERRAAGVAANARSIAAVRPENVRLSVSEPAADDNRLRGRVVTIVMLGDALEYVVSTEQGREYFARVPRYTDNLPKEGDPVWIAWPVSRTTLFPFEDIELQAQRISHERAAPAGDGSAAGGSASGAA
ncbi:MAG: ABC transporter ATP-binding protein [Dongiaceae bacterium]